MPKTKRKKYPKLPNSFGSIRYLGQGRRNCYAVHPPATIDELGIVNRPPALCYVDDYLKGFSVLVAYKAGTYEPGMEKNFDAIPASDGYVIVNRILSDYNTFKCADEKYPETHKLTFAEVYKQFLEWKFSDGKIAQTSKPMYSSAFKNCKKIHDCIFEDLKAPQMQEIIDSCPLKRSSVEALLSLFKQMYKYALYAEVVSENKAQFLRNTCTREDEHGVPFSEKDLEKLWAHSSDPDVQMILIMCYSGWRINELNRLDIDFEKKSFFGGSKTKAGKNRIVPIHPAIFDFVKSRIQTYGCFIPYHIDYYRRKYFYPTLEKLDMAGSPARHTPHDCRHTFSALCEKYDVRENDRKRMLGHSFQDVTNAVYGHRSLEDLQTEIEKIKIPFVTNL